MKEERSKAERLFKCEICGNTSRSKATFERHKQALHSKEKPFKCDHCETSFKFASYLSRHEFRMHNSTEADKKFKCDQCDHKFLFKGKLRDHLKTHLQIRSHKCDNCAMTFKIKTALNMHQKRVHLGEKPHQCKYCEKSFFNRRNLRRHLAGIHKDPDGAPIVKCEHCDYSTPYPEALKKHSFVHDPNKEKLFKCEQCDKGFLKRYKLRDHIINAHTDQDPYSCSFCTAKYKSDTGLSLHVRAHHSEKLKIPVIWYECDICGEFKTKLKGALTEHKGFHRTDVNVECEVCGKSLCNKKSLNHHMKLVHSVKDIRVNCDKCGMKLSCKPALKRHMERIHSEN